MTKPRFSIDDIDAPESEIFGKFSVGNDEENLDAADAKKPEATIKEDQTAAKNVSASPPAVATKHKENLSTPDPASAPKPKPQSTAATLNAKTGEMVKSYINCGVPTSLASRLTDLCAAGGFTEAYAMNWLLPKATRGVNEVNVSAMPSHLPPTDITGAMQKKWVYLDTGLLDQFRSAHDPLEAFSNADCIRHFYVPAFSAALDELAEKLKK